MSKHAHERNCNSTFLNNKFSTFSWYFKLYHFAFKHLLNEDKIKKKLPFPNPLFHYLLFKTSYIDLKYYIIHVKCIGYVGYKDYIE